MHVSDQRINFPCKICASSARGIGFALFCIVVEVRAEIEEYVQYVQNAVQEKPHSQTILLCSDWDVPREAQLGNMYKVYTRSVQIVHIMRAALIGKYAAPWSEGQFSLQRHLPKKHCSNTTGIQIQKHTNTCLCMCIHIYVQLYMHKNLSSKPEEQICAPHRHTFHMKSFIQA